VTWWVKMKNFLAGLFKKKEEVVPVIVDPPSDMVLHRKTFTNKSTIGELHLDKSFQCYTLEDTVRHGPKVYGQTAIPAGRYEIIINFSNRFQRPMPLFLNVPDFMGVRIHPGNTDKDTFGCILVGETVMDDFVGYSKDAFASLYPKIEEKVKKGKLFIEVV